MSHTTQTTARPDGLGTGPMVAAVPLVLPVRRGPRPAASSSLPHRQLDQQLSDDAIRAELAARAFSLPDVHEQPSAVSVPGARALVLDEATANGPGSAFLVREEFAHFHPAPDASLHVALPEQLARQAIAAGWAEHHPLVTTGELPPTIVMLYAPRDADELETTWQLVLASYRFANGSAASQSTPPRDRQGAAPMSIAGFRHVALTVTDLERSAAWYADIFGFEELFRESNDVRSAVVMRIPGTNLIVGLVAFPDASNDPFTPKRVGLDHLCFAVKDRTELEAWAARLDERGVDHSGLNEMTTGPIVNLKDPDGIALSLSIPPK